MHPIIQVKRSLVDGKIQYELYLSRENLNHLCAGCPDIDRLVGESPGGFYFYLFPNPQGTISESFRSMPDGKGYFALVGAPVPTLPPRVSKKEFDKLSKKAYDNLEKAINESGRIPIEDPTPFGTILLGYAIMKVEK